MEHTATMVDAEDKTISVSTDSTLQIPGYRLEKLIGSGAMASVYLAIQKSLERKVALKIMADSRIADATFRERFLREGRIIGQLSHPYIVTVHDIGIFHNCYYMAMEYAEGGTLKECIQQGLSPERAKEILCQIAKALGYAHKHGFVHRDVKPANILFREDGTAILSDFGIAKILSGNAAQLTAVGWTLGTPNYMSPEQLLGKPVDARSDLYSLGIVFYEMLMGTTPYHSSDAFSLALMHVNNPLPQLPKEINKYQDIINKLLAKKPEDRFANAEALIQALDSIQKSPATPYPPQVLPDTGRQRSRWPLRVGLAIPFIGGILYLLWVVFPNLKPWLFPTEPFCLEKAAKLFEVAKSHHDMGYLIEPPGMNATETYHRVLGLCPGNAKAEAALSKIADHFAKLAQENLNNPGASLKYVESGLKAVPNHSALHDLRKKLVDEQAAALLKVAEGHRDIGFLTDPPGMNAVELYHRVLQLDPDNTQAKAGLQAIADHYAEQAKESLKRGEIPRVTRELVENGLTAVPDDPQLLSLRGQLNNP